jgi:hypothetical protein
MPKLSSRSNKLLTRLAWLSVILIVVILVRRANDKPTVPVPDPGATSTYKASSTAQALPTTDLTSPAVPVQPPKVAFGSSRPSVMPAPISAATTPVLGIGVAANVKPIIASVMKFEHVYSSERYDEKPAQRIASLRACNCVTDQFLVTYAAVLRNTVDPNLAALKRANQVVQTATILNADQIDLSQYLAVGVDAASPAAAQKLPAQVKDCYLLAQTQLGYPNPNYGAASHELTIIWQASAWRVQSIPLISNSC